ncbi:MAG: GAF domain-containing sensor histidine kinase [Chloroflexi bacterium]|nr:GAF domain-containing sensor histidine kinase [Chloroflexota bacterium]
MPSLTTLLPAMLAVIYALLLVILAGRNRDQLGLESRRWLMLVLAVALLTSFVLVLPSDAETQDRYAALFLGDLTQPALVVILTNLMLVFFGTQSLRYLQVAERRANLWLGIALAWWAAETVAIGLEPSAGIGQDGWLGRIYEPTRLPGILALAGWSVIGATLLAASFYAFIRAHLPEIANRALLWAVITLLVLLGAILGSSGTRVMAEVGWLTQAAGLLGAVYSVSTYRVFDLRRGVRRATATAISTLITALIFFGVLAAAQELEADTEDRILTLAALALLVAVVYVPLRSVIQAVMNRLVGESTERTAHTLRKFSEDITGVVELDALVDVTLNTLSQVIRIRRGGLLLVRKAEGGGLQLEPARRGLGEIPDTQGTIAPNSPIKRRLLDRRAPLLQYDLDFGRSYTEVSPAERRFFQQMRMSAYGPVVVQGELIGLLCCGSKVSDDPFTEQDLELLMTIANQTGVALRNARLVDDLRRREGEQAELNKALSTTKEQLEKLDSVKTDFITIASHELRTPLAQIRGYTEIMEAMNEEGVLDQEQAGSMMANLRKAADRLENLIAAMLDVSQLDVNAMDLLFVQTSLENVVRMAIEPLTESIKARRLMLSARGLRALPPIQADMQRLVQAFRNIVLNSIKYTPDNGRIDIQGQVQGEEILITVQDSGIGIDASHLELIFEKFFRAHDPSLHSTGTTKFMGAGPGLGLTIARGVIVGHGGRIWVESPGFDPDNFPGTTIYIALPLNPPADAKRVLPFEAGLNVKQMQDLLSASGASSAPELSPTLARAPGQLDR